MKQMIFLSLLLALSCGCQYLTVNKREGWKRPQTQKTTKEGRSPSSAVRNLQYLLRYKEGGKSIYIYVDSLGSDSSNVRHDDLRTFRFFIGELPAYALDMT